jgi:hypothetical protein
MKALEADGFVGPFASEDDTEVRGSFKDDGSSRQLISYCASPGVVRALVDMLNDLPWHPTAKAKGKRALAAAAVSRPDPA